MSFLLVCAAAVRKRKMDLMTLMMVIVEQSLDLPASAKNIIQFSNKQSKIPETAVNVF